MMAHLLTRYRRPMTTHTPHHTMSPPDPERGDVPGWVLITLMTAGLVVVIWSAAGPALSGVFEQAITRVTGF
jgi:hypothetical protein